MTVADSTNQAIDAAVLDAIRGGAARAAQIEARLFPVRARSDKTMRAVDKALQRLKRANKVIFTHKGGWTVVGEAAQ